MSKISIYQIFTRLFGNTNTNAKINGTMHENGVGKMNNITDKALLSIKKLGVTHIWFTGIISHSKCFGYPQYNLPANNNKITKGLAGSPYAITDYYDVDADLAENISNRMQEFESLLQRTHKHGLKTIIDFVPNHVSREYKSNIFPEKTFGINDDTSIHFSAENDFYYLPNEKLQLSDDIGTFHENLTIKKFEEFPAKVTGNDKFSAQINKNDWYETVKLNYGVDYSKNKAKVFSPTPPLWNKMVDILNYWISKGVDGFRCDMAEMVPVEFWQYAISKIKEQNPHILFIGEIYNKNIYKDFIQTAKFDFLYNKVGLYDTLKAIIKNEKSTETLTQCEKDTNGFSGNMLNFMENHDEERIASEQFASNALFGLPAFTACATIDNGAVMTYFGQEIGEPAKGKSGYSGDDGKTTIFDYFNVPEHQKWVNSGKFDDELLNKQQKKLRLQYSKILNLAITNNAFSNGNFYDLMWANSFENATDKSKLYTYLRFCKNEVMLILLNFSTNKNQQLTVKISQDALQKTGLLNKQTVTIKGVFNDNRKFKALTSDIEKRGVWFNIPPHSSIILQII